MSLEPVRFGMTIGLGCLPIARAELTRWAEQASAIPDPERRRQALGSIGHKAFHSLGAAVFGALAPGALRREMVRFAVAYQTLSDYLDNLSDRSLPLPVTRCRLLHQAMVVAVRRPGAGAASALWAGDAYLEALVRTCRESLARFPAYERVEARNRTFARLYAQMQARKHAPAGMRRRLLERWFQQRQRLAGRLSWWEFAAASGSTLAIFALTACAAEASYDPAEADAVARAYFPWVCALHILLDYLIDLEEDAASRELNFAACYRGAERACLRLRSLYGRCRREVNLLPRAAFHRLVVAGLAVVYLSDPKAARIRPLLDSLAAEDPYLKGIRPLVSAWRLARPPDPPQVVPACGASLSPAGTRKAPGGRRTPFHSAYGIRKGQGADRGAVRES